MPSLTLLILFVSIDGFIQDVIIKNHLPQSVILLGQDEVNYSVSVLKNNIYNLQSILSLEILTIDSANSLYKTYLSYRISFLSFISFSSIVLAFLSSKKLAIRFDARRNVEKILKFIFFVFSPLFVLFFF